MMKTSFTVSIELCSVQKRSVGCTAINNHGIGMVDSEVDGGMLFVDGNVVNSDHQGVSPAYDCFFVNEANLFRSVVDVEFMAVSAGYALGHF